MHISARIATAGMAFLAAASWSDAQAYSQIIAFGDSLSDNGNMFAAYQTATGSGLPKLPYVDGRFSNGPVAVEVMAQALGVPLVDYAYGGALTGVDNRLNTDGVLNGTGMQDQVGRFTGALAAAGQKADASALYFLWGGGNDFFTSPTAQAAGKAITQLAGEVAQLYAAGAREFFVPLLPDLATTQGAIAGGATVQAQAHALTLGFNGGLSQALTGLQGQLPGSTIHLFDTTTLLNTVRAGVEASGGNVSVGCWSGKYDGTGGTLCQNPEQYYLWDSVHPTAFVHNTVGLAMAQSVPEPTTIVMMLAGLGVAVRRSARR